MKLGVLQFLSPRLDDLAPDDLRELRMLGFTGTGLPTGDDPATISTDRAAQVGSRFVDAGIDLVEYGRYHTSLVERDAARQREHLASLREAIRVAAAAGCVPVIIGAGSLNPAGCWLPHPENFSEETLDRLINNLREAVKPAEDAGLLLGLECHTLTALRNAETARLVLDAVKSPALRVHLDPVNWITWETAYRSGEATSRMFEVLGPDRLLGAHSKGFVVEDRLLLHMSETATGTAGDLFDHSSLIQLAAQMPGDFYVVIEHLRREEMPAARDHMVRTAERLGVAFEGTAARDGGK